MTDVERADRLQRELVSLSAWISELEHWWPHATVDQATEDCVGGIFAGNAGAKKLLKEILFSE